MLPLQGILLGFIAPGMVLFLPCVFRSASALSLDTMRCVRSALTRSKAAKMGDAERGMVRRVLREKG